MKPYNFLVYFYPMNRFCCIIFDLDGTISQTNELIFASFNYIAQKYVGKVFTPQEIAAMFGPPEEVAVEKLVGRQRVDEAMDDLLKFYDGHHPAMAEVHEGIREVLEFLKKKGIVLALFTGKGKHTALITLRHLGLTNYFDMIVTGHDVKEHKPSAEGIQKIIKTFGLDANCVLMVGDSIADVKAAHEAGVKIAAVLWDSLSKEQMLEMETDWVFHSVDEFSKWICSQFEEITERIRAQ